MQQFAIISLQLTKIISCKDISSKKLLWIVNSDNMWEYMTHFVELATWNFVLQNSAFLWFSVGLLKLSFSFFDSDSEDNKIEIDLNVK